MSLFPSLKNVFLDLLFPRLCLGCKEEGFFLCPDCRNKLVWVQPTCFVCHKWVPASIRVTAGRTCLSCRKKSCIYAFLSPFLYVDPLVRDLVHGLKYGRLRSLAPVLGELLAEYLAKFKIKLPQDTILAPIPLYPSRKRSRGFNQSELIVLYLSDRLGIRAETKILQKVRKTRPQIELSAPDRRSNLADAFAVTDVNLEKNKIILLLDDVRTTGATLEEAAKTLKKAGAKRIWALTIAR